MDEIKERVRTGYSRGWVVRKYATVGLWPSEAALCETYWRPGSRILDIGCGAGRTTLPLAANGYRTIGADLALPMVREARKQSLRGGLLSAWLALDATDLPFADCAFDGVLFSYNGIELVPGREGKIRVLTDVLRVLKPGGHFIFTTHALEAFNEFLPTRLRRLFRLFWSRALRRPIQEQEVGEVIHDFNRNLEVYYMQIISPRTYRKWLNNMGFNLIYYNSRQRIENDRPPRWYADFDPDFKFYVAQKAPTNL